MVSSRSAALILLPILLEISCGAEERDFSDPGNAGHAPDAGVNATGRGNAGHVADGSIAGTGGSSEGSSQQPGIGGGCPPPGDLVAFMPGCDVSGTPVVKIVGPCSLGSAQDPRIIELQAHAAGTCHVDFSYPDGATSSADVTIKSMWRPLGSDPHGCGQEFFAVDDTGVRCSPGACFLSVPDQSCDGGI